MYPANPPCEGFKRDWGGWVKSSGVHGPGRAGLEIHLVRQARPKRLGPRGQQLVTNLLGIYQSTNPRGM